jgi:hypothetical protein
MWWDQRNLNKPRYDKSGKKWNFRVWHDVVEGRRIQSIFFWDDKRKFCGVVLLSPGVLHTSRLHSLIEKLVADPALRAKHRQVLKFPLERHYSESGAFPERSSV